MEQVQQSPSMIRLTGIVVGISLIIFSIQALSAAGETNALAEIQRFAREANVKTAFENFHREHPTPSKEEVKQFEKQRSEVTIALLDRSKAYEIHYPQSPYLSAVEELAIENMWMTFGAVGLPLPTNRVTDVEGWIRERLRHDSQDYRLYPILVRIADALPQGRREVALEPFTANDIPEPARSMARDSLQKLKRLGHHLNLQFTALDGRVVDLATLKGKVVMIDFWSTVCVPCVRDFPDLKRLYQTYRPLGLEIIGISLDEDEEVLERFIEKEKIPWPQYFESKGTQNAIAQKFAIRSIPTVWLIDRRGILRDINGEQDKEQKLKDLLKQP